MSSLWSVSVGDGAAGEVDFGRDHGSGAVGGEDCCDACDLFEAGLVTGINPTVLAVAS
jgi:hypothetical protein